MQTALLGALVLAATPDCGCSLAWGGRRAVAAAPRRLARVSVSGRAAMPALRAEKEDDEQTVKDLNLEEMFEVFEAADAAVTDAEAAEAPETPVATTLTAEEGEEPEPAGDDNDIVKRVRPRDDWWADSGGLSSPLSGVAKGVDEDPLDKMILNSPIPSGAFLGLSVLQAIAFVGCIFELFYSKPAQPLLGVPLTFAIFAVTGPGFLLSFIAAIKKGNAETADDWLE